MLLACKAGAQDRVPDEVLSRFRTAPEPPSSSPLAASSSGLVILRLKVDDVDEGEHRVEVLPSGELRLPPEVAARLRIRRSGADGSALLPAQAVTLDMASSAAAVRTAAGDRRPLGILVEGGDRARRNSPESWGVWAEYDVNLRADIAPGTKRIGFGGGALVAARGAWPDFRVTSSWAATDIQPGIYSRLLNTVTWAPSWTRLAVSLGDAVSLPDNGGRSFRYGGIHVGTDLSSEPGFSPGPLLQVGGTAQALSTVEVLVGGQSVNSRQVSGGAPFQVVVPSSTGATVVLTDATGRRVEIPISPSRVEPGLIRQGLLLWNAGLGVPRFGFASQQDRYSGGLHSYASARYGLLTRLTMSANFETGTSGVGVLGAGFSALITPGVAVRTWGAASTSRRGQGARLGGALLVRHRAGFGFEVSHEARLGLFDDVVSATARDYAALTQRPTPFAEVPRSRTAARASWTVSDNFSLSAGYEVLNTETGTRSLATLSATTSLYGLPVFASATRGRGNGLGTSFLVGTTFSFGGGANASVSAGIDTAFAGAGRALGEGIGDFGWRVSGSRSGDNLFGFAGAETRTGSAIVGVEAIGSHGRGGTSTATYLRARGTVGVAAGVPFISDPVPFDGGLVATRTGRAGVTVERNGFAAARAGSRGSVIPVPVSGVPNRIGVDAAGLGIDDLADTMESSVTVRRGGVAVTDFRVRRANASAVVTVRRNGEPPPTGSVLRGVDSEAPVGPSGRAFLEAIRLHEVLTLVGPDGASCRVATNFDGVGGSARRLGPFECRP
jgi:outer membrane usher protein FimD/PapC